MRLRSNMATERGIALATTLLATLLIIGLMAGSFAAINADQRANAIDRDQSQAYSAAHAGLEKLTSDLASLFTVNVNPTIGQINALEAFPPNIAGFDYVAPGGAAGSGYDITWNGAPGPPLISPDNDITSGDFAGFKGIITPYTMTVTARSPGGAEVRLRRALNTVAVPVFQFGVFSEGDLTFYAGDDFDFGGRVHTNGHLFLAENNGRRLSFSDKMTVVGDVVRQNLSNGATIGALGFTGTVQILTAGPGNPATGTGYTAMAANQGSITGMPTGPVTPPPWAPVPNAIANWPTFSNGSAYFKGNIKNRFTGASPLQLPLVSQGAVPIDLIRRPALNSNEDAVNPLVYGQRFFSQASLRIILSDRVADITGLPTVTAGAPVALDGNWNAAPPAGYVVGPTRPPVARSAGPGTTTLNGNPNLVAANNYTIRVEPATGIPVQFRLPEITVEITPGVFWPMTCTGKTGTATALSANRFTGCAPVFPPLPLIIAPGRQVTATLASGATVSTTTVGATNVAGGSTVTVAANGTAAFAPISFFTHRVGNTASTNFPTSVSCTGYSQTANEFYGCAWATGVGNGNAPADDYVISTQAHQGLDVGLIGGFIKIERQDHNLGAGGTWTDVTMEILNLGIGDRNQDGFQCADPTPDAVLRIQRLKDNAFPNTAAPANPAWVCPSTSTNAHDWWPNILYDTREGNYRDVGITNAPMLGGAMQYIALDVRNLKRWLDGTIGAAGPEALNRNGYIVYFSDRRGDHNELVAGEPETGKYGFEDVVNRNVATGLPNGVIDLGEDVDGFGADGLVGTADDEAGAGTLQTFGQTPWFEGGVVWAGATNPYSPAGRPWHNINSASGRANRVVHFRRALKLVNGGINGGVNNLPTAGLTVAAENPVYVQGNYNATTNPLAEPNVPAAVLGDAVTVLSNNWTDARSFRFPNDPDSRDATITGYRFAVIAGKNVAFPFAGTQVPGGTVPLFGTDGGMGNFLRLLENWFIDGVSINYRGSVVSLYNSRQATGVFKWGPNVYDFGDRNFTFDSDFLQPALLPPGTPMFRDVNTLNFRQLLRPTQ